MLLVWGIDWFGEAPAGTYLVGDFGQFRDGNGLWRALVGVSWRKRVCRRAKVGITIGRTDTGVVPSTAIVCVSGVVDY